jgi:hypothetical protein
MIAPEGDDNTQEGSGVIRPGCYLYIYSVVVKVRPPPVVFSG